MACSILIWLLNQKPVQIQHRGHGCSVALTLVATPGSSPRFPELSRRPLYLAQISRMDRDCHLQKNKPECELGPEAQDRALHVLLTPRYSLGDSQLSIPGHPQEGWVLTVRWMQGDGFHNR